MSQCDFPSCCWESDRHSRFLEHQSQTILILNITFPTIITFSKNVSVFKCSDFFFVDFKFKIILHRVNTNHLINI